MSKTFQNPANGYWETVDAGASAGVFFFGALYLVIKGQWKHAFIWLLVVGIPTAASGGPFLLIALPLASIGYAIGIQSILEGDYLRRGWIDVTPRSNTSGSLAMPAPEEEETGLSTIPRAIVSTKRRPEAVAEHAPLSARYKQCPFCAEEVRYEAIKCKHCQSDLPPITETETATS